MTDWTAERLAAAAGAELAAPVPSDRGAPERVVIDSREIAPGDLFVGLPGEHADGGTFAPQALAAGAWGVLVAPEHADAARCAVPGVLLAAESPLAALQSLASAWRRELGVKVVAITGSTGKTSTKDILAGVLAPHRKTVASRQNYNTEIGLPLAILEAPRGTEVLVLELAMRGAGQIAELTSICDPDVGVIVNVGAVHVELLGTLEAIAAAKAELIEGMRTGTTAVIPAREELLRPHLREDIQVVTFGDGGDVSLLSADGARVEIDADGQTVELEVPFQQAHNRVNLLAAVAAARAMGVEPAGRVEVAFSALRGERIELPGALVIINDCYNANPMSMRAALDDLAEIAAGRRVAVLGDMLELGPEAAGYHREVGAHAQQRGVELLVAVGPLAAEMSAGFEGEFRTAGTAAEAARILPGMLEPGDTVLVKGSRGVGLEVVAEQLAQREAVS